MEDVGHSALLKFLVSGDTKMSETSNITSEVPGDQKLREGGPSVDNENPSLDPKDKAQSSLQEASTSDVAASEDFTLEPVITVTKHESTFTKGEMKLQKVTVTEDISTSVETKTSEAINQRLTHEVHTKIPSPTNAASKRGDSPPHTTEKENVESKRGKTKIPMSRFRQAVDQVKKEQKETKKTETVTESTNQSTTRKSSIPRLKDNKIAQLTTKDVKISQDEERPTVADEDEFDKIFREINEKGTLEVSISNEECVSQVESNFDEIIHAYEEDVQEKVQLAGSDRTRQSRIPTLKRRSEHDIERPLNREKYTIKKSLSVDMNKDDTSDVQTEYETENFATEEIQGYAETSNESITFRSETSYSNEYNTKRQGITCNENVYDRILMNRTDETFENAEERYRLSKYKQEPIDVDITEAVPIIDEPEDLVESSEITESYDDINVTSETQLTKISSEQVRFDKQIVSKIYKIDFTENTFEFADSETTEVSNGHTQATTKEEAINETLTSSISGDSSISKFVDYRKTKDAVGDFKASRFNTTSNETREYRDEQNATVSYTFESEQRFVKTSEERKEQSEVLTKVETKHSIETLRPKNDHEDKLQDNATTNITESITIEPLKEIEHAEKNNQNNTTYNAKETGETTVNVNKDITISESTVKINGTEKTATYSSSKYSHKNTGSSAIENKINDKKDGENNTSNTTGSIYIRSAKEKRETGDASASLTTREDNKETEHTNTESNTITKLITKDQKVTENSSSTLVKNISKELEKHTQSKETNLVITQDAKEIKPKTSWVLQAQSKDITNTTTNSADLTQSINETKITSNLASNQADIYETKVTKNQTESQSTFKSTSNSYEANRPVTEKFSKQERSENNNHDAETYKIYSDVFSKLSTAKVTTLDTKAEYNQKLEFSTKSDTDTSDTLTVQENSSKSGENSVLSGKVSKIINFISSIDSTKTEDKELVEKDVPKRKSILSKIALFERDEPYERIPKPKALQPEPKPLRGLAALRQTSRELRKPKIVDEIYKEYSERETVQRNTKLLSEKDEEEITIEVKNVKNDAEVNQFDSAFKAKLYDNKTTNNETRDIPKTEYFNIQKDIGIKDIGEEGNQEEITIEIKDVTNDANVSLSNSTFKSKQYEYNSYKYDILKRAKSENFHTQQERTKEKNIKESVALTSSASDLLHGINESKTKENKQLNADENLTIHYESSSKISNNATSTSSNISNETSNSFRRTISSTNLVVDKATKETDDPKMSDRWKVNEIDKNKKKLDIDITRNEESKDMSNEKMTKRMRRRDPILQRAISVVEDDLNDVMKGKVKGLISRINSMEQMELTRKRNQEKNRPWASVSERIALFEEKASKAKAEKSTEGRTWRTRTVETAPKEMDEETCMKRIAELKEAKKTYGSTNTNYMELRDGTKMPVIALGTALLDKRLVRQVVETAIDLGYRAIDTAFIYGNEKEIGEGINAKISDGTVKREELFITSKLWSTFHRRDLVERACRTSLETMGLTYFDLYLIHNPMSLKEGGDPIPKIANVLQFSEHDFMDAWYGIEDLVTKGLVKSAGLSNFNSEQVHRVTEKGRLKPVVNQVECHPYLSQDRLAGFCDAYGMKLVCFGSLGSKGTPKTLKSSLPPAIEDPLVQVMAAGLGVSPAQLLLAFQVKKGRGVVAKASSASHLHDNLAAQRLPLATGQLTALAALDRHKRTYTFEGMGETHKNYPFNIAF